MKLCYECIYSNTYSSCRANFFRINICNSLEYNLSCKTLKSLISHYNGFWPLLWEEVIYVLLYPQKIDRKSWMPYEIMRTLFEDQSERIPVIGIPQNFHFNGLQPSALPPS